MSENSESTQAEQEQRERQRSEDSPIPETTRRNAAKFLLGVSGTVAVGTYAVDYLYGMFSGGIPPQTGPIYVKGTQLLTEDGKPIKVDTLPKDGSKTLTAFPKDKNGEGALVEKDASTVLVRFPEDKYKPPTNVDGTVKGYVAYSKVCTHEGCFVSERDGQNLSCPCHGSVYDPLEGAKVVGGPAPRGLPQLPIGITKQGNLLMATGPFEGPIGPQ